jgi:predicted dehydrogenase
MNGPKLRWGILSTAEIARKNWKAIRNSGNGVVTAVASRTGRRSQDFIAQCQRGAAFKPAPQALESYEALLASPDVDAVYIPLPTALRKEWVIRAAEAGKHVVCEKPCASGLDDLRQMIDACRRHGVQFLDGVMFMHSRRLESVRRHLADLGQVKRIASAFAFKASPEFFAGNIRALSELEPFGCLGDLGWYCLRFALWTMNFQLPRRVSGRLLSQFKHKQSRAPVSTEFSAELFFDGGVSSGFYCSFITELQQWVHVSGTHGLLHFADFVLPDQGSKLSFEVSHPAYRIAGCDFRMKSGTRRFTVPEHSHGHPSAQETNLFRNFANQVRSGRLNEAWPDMALKTQQVMEACLASALAEGIPVEIH